MKATEKTPIELLTDMLAAMTERAMKAEAERDAAKSSSDEWFKHYQRKDKEHKELQEILAAEIRGHEKTRAELDEAVHACRVLNDELENARKTEPAPQA